MNLKAIKAIILAAAFAISGATQADDHEHNYNGYHSEHDGYEHHYNHDHRDFRDRFQMTRGQLLDSIMYAERIPRCRRTVWMANKAITVYDRNIMIYRREYGGVQDRQWIEMTNNLSGHLRALIDGGCTR